MDSPQYKRVFLIVLDSLGIGAMPDAKDFGDEGSHTLGHICETTSVKLPHLESLGLGNIAALKSVSPAGKPIAHYGKCAELAKGKDTTTGHWEIAGIHVKKSFPTFYDGFPQSFIDAFVKQAKLKGVLGNIPASGTEIIQKLGDEHLATGFPIVYTSADSVFQIACHEESFGLARLYEICEVARKLCDDLGIARVIARPFLGSKGNYTRTKNRKDYSVALPSETVMHKLQKIPGIETISIGKVASIYSEEGFHHKIKASDNRAIFDAILNSMDRNFRGLVFANLVDFDMLYGHRRNTQGYADELKWFDDNLPTLLGKVGPDDLVLFTADHGNDPTFHGTDHTREYIPLIAFSKKSLTEGGKNLGTRTTFADIGQTILEGLGSPERMPIGKSFLGEMV